MEDDVLKLKEVVSVTFDTTPCLGLENSRVGLPFLGKLPNLTSLEF